MNDEQPAVFWEEHEPEEFKGWEEGNLDFGRPPQEADPAAARPEGREDHRQGIQAMRH